jgi:DtxR family Mn-dependent transcriptional regulator
MDRDLSPAIQDYLKAIYTLSETGEPATTNALAGRLGVAPASVTSMLQKLSGLNPPLVTYQKHQGVRLTQAGRQAALKVIRYHRLMELYLVEALGFSWDEVHEEADRLEHVMSDHLVEHLAEALGNPIVDPHGDPIPSVDLELDPSPQTQLLRLRGGQGARVARIGDDDPQLLRYLTGIGLVPGADIQVVEYIPFDQTLRIHIGGNGQDMVIGPAIASKVYVTN